MKNFWKTAGKAFIFCAVMMIICSFVYPLALTGVSQLTMKEKANGSLMDKEGKLTVDHEQAVGSVLIGQQFTEDYYFQGRPSSVNYNNYTEEALKSGEYGGVSSGSYNYGNSNPALKDRVQKDLDAFLEDHPGLEPGDIPSDLLTASGSGLDPHITPKAAEIQIPYVTEIVKENTEHKVLGIFGEERVNVLKCNLAVADAMGILAEKQEDGRM